MDLGAIQALSASDLKALETELKSLPVGSSVLSIYGLNGRHVAWVEVPRPHVPVKNKKPIKEGKGNATK